MAARGPVIAVAFNTFIGLQVTIVSVIFGVTLIGKAARVVPALVGRTELDSTVIVTADETSQDQYRSQYQWQGVW